MGAGHKIFQNAELVFNKVEQFNNEFFRKKDCYDFKQQQFNHQYIRSQTTFRSSQSMDSAQRSKDGTLFVAGVDCENVIEALHKAPGYMLLNSSVDQKQANGVVGVNFVVDIAELEYAYLSECYYPKFKFEMVCTFKEYNLFISEVYTETLILKAKSNFFISIGQSIIKDAKSKVSSDMLITTSLLPMVTALETYSKTKEQISQEIQQLIQASQSAINAEV